jgi:hypothetical protein
MHGGEAFRVKEVGALKLLEVVNGLLKAVVQVGDGVVDVSLDRHQFGWLGFSLRKVERVFSFICSHIACLQQVIWLGWRSVLTAPDVAR